MQRLLPFLLTALVLPTPFRQVVVADEPARDSFSAIAQDAVDLQNDLSAILEAVKSKEDLEKAGEKIAKLRLGIERLKARTEKLLSDTDDAKLLAKLATLSAKNLGAAGAAEERYQAALRKLPADARQVLETPADSWDALAKDIVKLQKDVTDAVKKGDKDEIEKIQNKFKLSEERFKKLRKDLTDEQAQRKLMEAIEKAASKERPGDKKDKK